MYSNHTIDPVEVYGRNGSAMLAYLYDLDAGAEGGPEVVTRGGHRWYVIDDRDWRSLIGIKKRGDAWQGRRRLCRAGAVVSGLFVSGGEERFHLRVEWETVDADLCGKPGE